MKRRGIGITGWFAAAACAATFAIAPLLAGEEPAEPEFLGAARPEQILKISPEWKAIYDAYSPDAATVAKIGEAVAKAKGDLRIEVIFGSWCSDSLDQVPPFLKILDQAGKDIVPAVYTGVTRAKEKRGDLMTNLKIEAIPTFIVYRKDAEIGRIVETPKATLEADLLEILAKPVKC
jgi:hypothetical protein